MPNIYGAGCPTGCDYDQHCAKAPKCALKYCAMGCGDLIYVEKDDPRRTKLEADAEKRRRELKRRSV